MPQHAELQSLRKCPIVMLHVWPRRGVGLIRTVRVTTSPGVHGYIGSSEHPHKEEQFPITFPFTP